MAWTCENDCHEHADFVAEMWESRKDLIVHSFEAGDKELRPCCEISMPKVYVGGDQDTEITGPWCSSCQKELQWEEEDDERHCGKCGQVGHNSDFHLSEGGA